MTKAYRIEDLLSLMDKLRDPEFGCSWDRKQSLRTLTAYTLEEVYEVIDAVETGDDAQLQDELGDLLFQVVFYAQIAKEEGRFEFSAVIASITEKLLRRHPHVFPDGSLDSFGNSELALNAEQVAERWELIKNEERAQKALAENESTQLSVLDDIPSSLPALDRARKLQKRAASVGFDWPAVQGVIDKVKEELAELEEELAQGDQQRIEEEFGDLMFSCVNLARHLQIDPESSLRASNRKFETRFRTVESLAGERSGGLEALDETQLNGLWDQVKATEKTPSNRR
jgi:ATP diphosphatase